MVLFLDVSVLCDIRLTVEQTVKDTNYVMKALQTVGEWSNEQE